MVGVLEALTSPSPPEPALGIGRRIGNSLHHLLVGCSSLPPGCPPERATCTGTFLPSLQPPAPSSIIDKMRRGPLLLLAALLSAFSLAALLLNLAAPRLACRLRLCPETVALAEARRLLLAGTPQSAAESVRLYRRLVSRNPASPYRWCDLGDAQLAAGDLAQARDSFHQAQRLGPNIPQTLLRVAGFHFRLQEYDSALPLMARILSLTPNYDRLLFSYYDRMDTALASILERGIPPQPRAAQSYFLHVLKTAPPERAAYVWRWLLAGRFAGDAHAAAYTDFLVRNRRYSEAASAWASYLGPRSGDYPSPNLLFNGGFESPFLPCPFDWRLSPLPGAEASRDSSAPRSGSWSLRLRFLGSANPQYRHLTQLAAVKPGPVLFRAFLKSDSLTTDQGLGFRIFDYESPSRLDIHTPRLTGSAGWTELRARFVIPSATSILAVQLVRDRSIKFDNLIAGTAWIDDVVLQPLTP